MKDGNIWSRVQYSGIWKSLFGSYFKADMVVEESEMKNDDQIMFIQVDMVEIMIILSSYLSVCFFDWVVSPWSM